MISTRYFHILCNIGKGLSKSVKLVFLLNEYVKLYGKENDLLDRIKADPVFDLSEEELASLCDPNTFTGMAPQQTEEYLEGTVRPILEANKELLGEKAEVNV